MHSRWLVGLILLCCVTGCSKNATDDDCDEASAAWHSESRQVDRSCSEAADCVYGRWDACTCPIAANADNDFEAIRQLRTEVENTCGYALCANNVVCPESLDTVAPAHPPLCVNSRCTAPEPAYVEAVTIEPSEVTIAEVEAGTGAFTVTATMVGDYGAVEIADTTLSITARDAVGTPTSVTESSPGTLVLEVPYSWLDGLPPRTYAVDVELVTEYETFFRNDIAEVVINP